MLRKKFSRGIESSILKSHLGEVWIGISADFIVPLLLYSYLGQAGSIGSPPRFDLALQVESQLFPKENIFRFERSARTRPQKQEPQNVLGQIKKDGDQPKQGLTSSHGLKLAMGALLRAILTFQLRLRS